MIIFFSRWFVNSYWTYHKIGVNITLHHGEMKAYAYSEMKIPLASEYILLHPIFTLLTILLCTLYKKLLSESFFPAIGLEH